MNTGFKKKIVFAVNARNMDLCALAEGEDWEARETDRPGAVETKEFKENMALLLVCCADKSKLAALFSTFELRMSNLPTVFVMNEEDPETVKLCYQNDFTHIFMATEKQSLLKAHINYTFNNYEIAVRNNGQKWLRHIDPSNFTKKEYQIIEFIAQAPMTELSREELQNHIWGKGKNTTNKLDVHICNLRKKLNHNKLTLRTNERGKVALAVASEAAGGQTSHFDKKVRV